LISIEKIALTRLKNMISCELANGKSLILMFENVTGNW
jgi:hypothetical protein